MTTLQHFDGLCFKLNFMMCIELNLVVLGKGSFIDQGCHMAFLKLFAKKNGFAIWSLFNCHQNSTF